MRVSLLGLVGILVGMLARARSERRDLLLFVDRLEQTYGFDRYTDNP